MCLCRTKEVVRCFFAACIMQSITAEYLKEPHLCKSSATLPVVLTQTWYYDAPARFSCSKPISFCRFCNFRAIINHFNPKIESYAAVNHISQLSEDQVTEYDLDRHVMFGALKFKQILMRY